MVDYSERQLMAVMLSRELRDGDVVVTGGVRSAVPVAGVFLAQHLHGPNITVVMGMGVVNPRPDRVWSSAGNHNYSVGCEGYISMDDIFELSEAGRLDVAFYGGLQIDRLGNANLTWVQVGNRRIRGPGVANSTLALTVGRTILYSEHHTPRVFVPEVDFNTIPGHVEGRKESGSGAGPASCITPLGVFGFPEPRHVMRARSLHPGVDPEDVRAATAFEPELPEDIPTTKLPTAEEMEILLRLDPEGLLTD